MASNAVTGKQASSVTRRWRSSAGNAPYCARRISATPRARRYEAVSRCRLAFTFSMRRRDVQLIAALDRLFPSVAVPGER